MKTQLQAMAQAAAPYRIALINPNTNAQATRQMVDIARQSLPPDAQLSGLTVPVGPGLISDQPALDESRNIVLAFGCEVATQGFDALIIAGFGDPGLYDLRAKIGLPVTGLAEAGIREAAEGGRRFSIVTVTPQLHASLLDSAERYGHSRQLASIRYTEGDLRDVMADPTRLTQALMDACRLAMTVDGAQAIVIGGGPLASCRDAIAQQLPIPIIDPVGAATRLTCLRLEAQGGQSR